MQTEQHGPDLSLVPEPWEYNPSKWSQRTRVALVALPAFLAAVYMGLYQWRLIPGVWDPIFGEQTLQVLDSDLSHRMGRWFRMPDAIAGALAYLGDIIFALAGSTRRWQFRPWLVVLFGLDVIPLGIVSAILVFSQGAVVGAWCFLCLFTAVISLLLVILAYDEVWSSLLFLTRIWRKTRSWRSVWWTFWGWPSELAHEVALEMSKRPRR
jgi:hypothetical protein